MKRFFTYKKYIFKFMVLYLLTLCITVINPYVSGRFIDAITYSNTLETVYNLAILYSFLLVTEVVFGYFLKINIIELKSNISFDFKREVIKHYHGMELLIAEKYEAGYIYSRINQDIDFLVVFVLDNLVSMISNAGIIIAALVFLFCTNVKIFVCSLLFIPIYLLLYFYMKKEYFRRNKDFKEKSNFFLSSLLEQFVRVREFKIMADEKRVIKELEGKYSNYLLGIISFFSFSERFKSIDGVISVFFQIATMIISAVEIHNGAMSIGGFVVIISYFSFLLSALKYYGDLGKNFQEAKVSKMRIDEIMNENIEHDGKKLIEEIENITLQELSYSYRNMNVIEGISIAFVKGKSYAIVGGNGMGKSTLANILIGLYPHYEGRIEYNGIELADINKCDIRKNHCSYMQQNSKPPNITICEFLEFSLEGFNYGMLEDALEEYKLDSLFGQGFDIRQCMGIKCSELSGGQWQKVQLLCIIMKKKELIVLDEPTSSWDEKGKKVFNEMIQLLKRKKILLVITHDEMIAQSCDYIIRW